MEHLNPHPAPESLQIRRIFYNENPMASPGPLRFGSFELDPVERSLRKGNKPIPLEPKTFEVLLALVNSAGKLVARKTIFDAVWPAEHVVDANLTNRIATLRRTLGFKAIETVSKTGYRFSLPVTTLSLSPAVSALLKDGQSQMDRRTTECVQAARNLFLLAIVEDPSCATAWAWLARSCRFLEKYGVERSYHRQMTEGAFRQAFELDPDLACAHQFSTVFQVDQGKAVDAMTRLLRRVQKYPQDAHSFEGLVHACRHCGLLEASVAAHRRAIELDPRLATSIAHTHFAACDYEATVESYAGTSAPRGYLDLAAWACLGSRERVESEINKRLASRSWAPKFEALMKSLLEALRGNSSEVQKICDAQDTYEDPEGTLYLARHLAYCGRSESALAFLEIAHAGGLTIPIILERDPWLRSLREDKKLVSLLEASLSRRNEAERRFRQAGGVKALLAPNAKRSTK